ncbi:hypothetical protein NDU88_006665 [Pleurodeles waltl]|uniref:Uncharacterized protein n=1 Tax=Pleurodeles waltl TaxID=8319 RepID=A0AAV7TXV2_PLEWA|nr:hypothetical protein NDU88_006665 [Pleurodeles waltl]
MRRGANLDDAGMTAKTAGVPGSGALVHSQTVISEVFRPHLCTICRGGGAGPRDCGREFLDGIDLHRLSDEDKIVMDDPIHREELRAALKRLKPSKTPGGNGLPAKFGRKYANEIVDKLLKVFQEALQWG